MIEIRNVSKAFDNIKAVDDVSVSIKENTVFGLIGTNGAGKSTVLSRRPSGKSILLRMNLTFLQTAMR